MGVSCTLDSIARKMDLVGELNFTKHNGVRINPTAQFQRLCMFYVYCQHDGAPPHFSQVLKQYLNHKFPNRWIGRGGAQNWPPRSPDLNPLVCHVWGYVKAMVYTHKVNTREELFQRILSAVRCISNATVLRKVTSSLVTRVRKCIKADGGHFEQLV